MDRMDLVTIIENDIKPNVAGKGVLHLANERTIYKPTSKDQHDTGLMGRIFENLLGGTLSGAGIPDFGKVELKTTRITSKSNITLGSVYPEELYQKYSDTALASKVESLVLVFLKPNDVYFEKRFPHTYLRLPDQEVDRVVSYDMANKIIRERFEESYEALKAIIHKALPPVDLDSSLFSMDKEEELKVSPVTLSAGMLQYDIDSKGNRRWKMKRKFAEYGIESCSNIVAMPSIIGV